LSGRAAEVFHHQVYSSSLDLVSLLTYPLLTVSLSGNMSGIGNAHRCPSARKTASGINRLLCSSRLFAQLRLVFLSIEGASSVCSSSVDGVHSGGGGAPASGAHEAMAVGGELQILECQSITQLLLPSFCARCSAPKGVKSLTINSTGTGLVEYVPYMYSRVYVSILHRSGPK
jgi:hypothetical protein